MIFIRGVQDNILVSSMTCTNACMMHQLSSWISTTASIHDITGYNLYIKCNSLPLLDKKVKGTG